jgi:hypothetical protein
MASRFTSFERFLERSPIMARTYNTNASGDSFDAATIDAVWAKGTIVADYNPAEYRKDACGIWIKRAAHGDTASKYGWEIDHRLPVVQGGSDAVSNLEPLHWRNNRGKADNYPEWACTLGNKLPAGL